MAQSKMTAKTTQAVSLADFAKKHEAAKAELPLLVADIGDGIDTGHGEGMVAVNDPTDLGIGTMRAVVNAEKNLNRAGFVVFEAMFSPEDFRRLLDADPPVAYVAQVMEQAVEHYGVPREGESVASRA